MADIGEPDVILADGGTMKIWQWVAQKTTPCRSYTIYFSKHEKLAGLVSSILFPKAMSMQNNMNNIYVVLICDVVTFLEIRNMYATRFSSDATEKFCMRKLPIILF